MDKEPVEIVSEITKFSTRDGPGIRTSVFLKGCPLRCKWCSNPETFRKELNLFYMPRRCTGCGRCEAVCPQHAISSRYAYPTRIDRKKCVRCMKCVEACFEHAFQISGQYYSVSELMKIIERDKIFFGKDGGITISGGEPLMSPDFVLEMFRRCKEQDIGTVLDSTGYGNTERLLDILEYTDLVLLDIKLMDPVRHKEWTGVTNELILKNARIIMEKVPCRFSLPLIPGVNDDDENIKATAEFAAENGVKNIDINLLHTLGTSKYHFLGRLSPYGRFGEIESSVVDRVIRTFRDFGLEAGTGRMM